MSLIPAGSLPGGIFCRVRGVGRMPYSPIFDSFIAGHWVFFSALLGSTRWKDCIGEGFVLAWT